MLIANDKEILLNVLRKIRSAKTYRSFLPLALKKFPTYLTPDGRELVNMSSNDYLAFSQNARAKAAAIQRIHFSGAGAGGSRNIGGTRSVHIELEEEFKDLYRSGDALLYTSGNVANSDVITTISRYLPATVFFSDEENHASIIEPIRSLPKQRRIVFPHNNAKALELLLEQRTKEDIRPVIVVESIYSMSGDFCPLQHFVQIAEKYNCLFVVNEVHALGVRGARGAGRCEELGLLDGVDIAIGSLSKSYGCFGGFIAGRSEIVDCCRQTGTRSIFTTALPEYVCAAALENVRYRKSSTLEVDELFHRLRYLKSVLLLKKREFGGHEDSHIVPIIVGDENRVRSVARKLESDGFYATPICYPTVPLGKARLRITVTPQHLFEDIDRFVKSLEQALNAPN